MKKIYLLLLLSIITLSCSYEPVALETQSTTNSTNLSAKSVNSTSNSGDYKVVVAVSSDGSEWTYTITRAVAKAKNLSHFIIDLNNCGEESATFADIISATVNGSPANLSPTEGSGTGCNPQATTTNFVKFNVEAATSWVIVLKFSRGYEIFTTATSWLKAGTSCNQAVISAPGCPKKDYCSYSQGFFFGNGAQTNGASLLWSNGLTIGGINYTQTQGRNAWTIDRGRGGDITMNAFFQLSAVRLSGVENEVAAEATIIDAYFNGIDVNSKIMTGSSGPNNTYQYFNLPAVSGEYTKAQVAAAGSRIGLFIKDNHCEE